MEKGAVDIESSEGDEETENNRPTTTRVKNRRKAYLDRNPDYFGPSLELAGRRITG